MNVEGDSRIIIHCTEREAQGLVIQSGLYVQFVFLLSKWNEGGGWVDDFKGRNTESHLECIEFAYWGKWAHREE